MAKDPAFLFYPNDYIGGTMGMTFEEKGAYIELLMMQFNRGHMTSDMVGQIVGHLWDKIRDKFIQDENGLWYNKRLEDEKLARQKYSESRRNNLSGANQYSKKTVKKEPKKQGHKKGHMTSHMEDEDKDIVFSELELKWNEWKKYKFEQFNFKYKSEVSEKAAFSQLMTLSRDNDAVAMKIIEQSIANGWKGFFKLTSENRISTLANEVREDNFKKEVSEFKDTYSSDVLNAFFAHWSQWDADKKYMKFELEQTWETNKRLYTWKNRS